MAEVKHTADRFARGVACIALADVVLVHCEANRVPDVIDAAFSAALMIAGIYNLVMWVFEPSLSKARGDA